MNSAIRFDPGWFVIHIKGSQVRMSKLKSTTVFGFVFNLSKHYFVALLSKQRLVTFHLNLHCSPKYSLRSRVNNTSIHVRNQRDVVVFNDVYLWDA